MRRMTSACLLSVAVLIASNSPLMAEGDWETNPASEAALRRGLDWLAYNQGPEGNWGSNDMGLVALGALAFLADGHSPGRGRYGENVERTLNYLIRNAKPSGLLNIADTRRDMYNHGLATFVLGQAHGMTNDPQISKVLDRSLKLICDIQSNDGGWDYIARRTGSGHDLSLVVMQAKALRSAVDSGLEVRREVIQRAIDSVRRKYKAKNGSKDPNNPRTQEGPGQFTYDGNRGTTAMAAAGVVCLQEFGQYDDWRIPKNMELITQQIRGLSKPKLNDRRVAFDAYTLYYVGQALYQRGGKDWEECYPILRDHLVRSQSRQNGDRKEDGYWRDPRYVTNGNPCRLFGTSVACFILAIPNRYLPILQEGKIESIRQRVGGEQGAGAE
ncbi:MAG: squalene--hopene cyclase [Planctomycetaceae bacterium]|nr:squalene--hopene cyclase [Planctomycetaceae bacterium]